MSTVYLHRFNLERQPFALLPDTDFFFEGERRGALLQGLRQAMRDNAGLCVVSGEVGTGKTMLCRLLGKQLAQDDFDVAFVPDASLPRDALLACIAADLGLPCDSPGGAALALQQALLSRSLFGQRLVLLVDEAHTLRPEALDAVRMLMNVETGQCKLLQIVLFGQPELNALLDRPDLRQVRDRITHHFELPPLSREGAQAYLEHRLRTAGWNGERLLEPEAMAALVRRGAGRFRALGLLADKALLAAYADGARSVAASHVARAWKELQHGVARPWRRRLASGWQSLAAAARAPTAGWRLPPASAPQAMAALGLAALAALAVPLGQGLGQRLAGETQAQGLAAAAAHAKASTAPREPGSTSYDALVAQAPPAAARRTETLFSAEPGGGPLAGLAAMPGGFHTVSLASAPSREAALAEAKRLAALAGLKPLFVLYRPGNDPSRPSSATPWVVCAGLFSTAQEAAKAQAGLARPVAALRPRILKVES